MQNEPTPPSHPMVATHFEGQPFPASSIQADEGVGKTDFANLLDDVLGSLPPTLIKEQMTEAYKKWVADELPARLYNKDGTLRPLNDILRPLIQVPIAE